MKHQPVYDQLVQEQGFNPSSVHRSDHDEFMRKHDQDGWFHEAWKLAYDGPAPSVRPARRRGKGRRNVHR